MPANPLDDLDRRLAVIRDRVRGVAYGHHTGFYLYGRAGTAKTYNVRKTLEKEGCKYHYHNGHLTPMGLFDLFYEQHDRVIVLDDVAEIFRQPIALQHLLAALGNQPDEAGGRIIKYRRQRQEVTVHFTGGVIMISNLTLSDGPVMQALKSRVHYLHYDPSDEQVAAMMRAIAANGWPSGNPKLTPPECMEVADFLIGESEDVGCRLDLRLLVDKAFPDYLQYRSRNAETHWKDLIRTCLEERLVELKYTAPAKTSRKEIKEEEYMLIRHIIAQHQSRSDRATAWVAATGKSERAFYRRLEELGA